jgi:hypothetical protein
LWPWWQSLLVWSFPGGQGSSRSNQVASSQSCRWDAIFLRNRFITFSLAIKGWEIFDIMWSFGNSKLITAAIVAWLLQLCPDGGILILRCRFP